MRETDMDGIDTLKARYLAAVAGAADEAGLLRRSRSRKCGVGVSLYLGYGNSLHYGMAETPQLVGDLTGALSRRINIQHRLVYEVLENERIVKVLRLWSHYD